MAHIQKLPSGSYRLRWIDPSGTERSKVHKRKSDAERHKTEVEHSVIVGSYVDPVASKMTVGMMAEEWFASKINLRPSTRALYQSILDVHILPRWRSIELGRVGHTAVQRWAAELVAAGVGPGHVHKIIGSVLRGVLALAVRSRRLAMNPCEGVQLPRVARSTRRYLTASQVAALAEQSATLTESRPRRATDGAFQQYELVVLSLSYCGLRWSEIAALRVGRVDLLRRRLSIEDAVVEVNGARLEWGPPKSHEARSVPIPSFLADRLAAHLANKTATDLVFTAPDGGVMRNRNARRAWFDRAAEAIGMPGLTPHELRHTAASLAVSAGANVKAVQRMLGHASAAVTLDRYTDLFDSDLDAVADRLDAVFRANLAPRTALRRHQAQIRDLDEAR